MAGSLKRSHKVAFAVGAALVLGASISTVRDRSIAHRHPRVLRSSGRALRQSSSGDRLECRLSLFAFLEAADGQDGPVEEKDVYFCSPLFDGVEIDQNYQIELDDDLRKEYDKTVRDGFEPVLSISGASIDDESAQIVLSGESEISLVDRKRRRKLLASTGRLSALALRIILNDGEPDYSQSEIYHHMYQDTHSLKNQYRSCSFGKLVIEPTSAGVIEVRIKMYGSISSHQTVVNAASNAALEYLYQHGYGSYSQLRQYADIVLYITPDMGGWLAYGAVGGAVSVYNNKWGGFISALMHETGHNFGLLHAFEGEEYLDYTGYVSAKMAE